MDPVFRTIVSLCLSVLFAAGAAHKLRSRALFQDQLAAYGLVPLPLIGTATFMLAMLELVLAAALLVPFMAAIALCVGALTLTCYAMAMELVIWRGHENIDCGCSGVEGSTAVSNSLVLRNLFLSVIAIGAAMPLPERNLSWSDLGLCVLVAGTAMTFYQAANQLMANRPHLKMWRTA